MAYCGIGCITYLSSRLTGYSIQPARAKINAILKETDTYPEELLDMLSRNPDMLDFVEGYPEKKGQVFADTIGHVKKENFHFYYSGMNAGVTAITETTVLQ